MSRLSTDDKPDKGEVKLTSLPIFTTDSSTSQNRQELYDHFRTLIVDDMCATPACKMSKNDEYGS